MTFRGDIESILPRGGLNNSDSAFNLDDQSPACRNVRFEKKGVYKRDGANRYISTAVTAAAATGLAQLILSSGTTYQVALAGDDIAVEDSGVWTSIKGALTLTADQDSHFQFCQLTDLLIGTNNVNPVWKFSGTGNAAALGGVPTSFLCKAITTYKNYVVTLNTSESGVRRKGRFRWSDLNNAESWTAANYNDILNNEGQVGQGFGLVGDQLFAFFDRSIQEVVYTGDSINPFVFPTGAPKIGSVSGNAIVPVDDAIFFPTYKGIYALKGGVPVYISEPIEGTWATLNKNRLDSVVGCHNRRDNEVWFSVTTGSGTTHDLLLVYDYVQNKWTEFDSWNVNAFGDFPATKALIPIFGDYDGVVFSTNTGTYLDDGGAIDGYVRTKLLRMGDAGRKGQVKLLEVIADGESETGATLKISHGYDFATVSDPNQISSAIAGALWDSFVWDVDKWASTGLKRLKYRPTGHGYVVQFEFRNAQASVGMGIADVLAHTVRARRIN